RLEQRGLLAADVRAGAAVHDDVEIETRAEDVGAEEPSRACVVERAGETVVTEREFPSQVNEREIALDRERRDDDALDQLVRVALDEHPILERRRLAFVAVDDEVARERSGRQERPLLPGREVRTAPTAQARDLYLLLHVGGIALREHRTRGLVTPGREHGVD